MPVPTSWDDISTNPVQNSPQGNEPLGNQADDYIRQAFAFTKQLHDGWLAADGSVTLKGNLNANGHTVTGLAAPVNAGDAVPKSYADNIFNVNFPRGTIILWFGAAGAKPVGWLICDGTQGTPDLRDRFPVGAGGSMGQGGYGGNNSPVISVAQLPPHSHPLGDPGHAHGVYDPGHGHGISDPGHSHSLQKNASAQAGSDNNGMPIGTDQPYYSTSRNPLPTNGSGTGIGIYGNSTGIGIYGSGTGISIGNTGGGAAFDNRPAFCSVYFIMKA